MKVITITVENESQKEQIVDILLEAEGDGVLAFPYNVKVDDEVSSVDSRTGSQESDCCGALIILTDICSNCKEHCDELEWKEEISKIRRIK